MSDQRLVVIDEWGGKFVINEFYRPLATALCQKFPELQHIPAQSILFVDNTESKAKNKNKYKNAQIAKMPEKWQQIIYQMSGKTFDFIMEFFKLNIFEMSREQIIALVYHELRHIHRNGDLILHDIEDWSNMHYKLGADWNSTKRLIPDLLDLDVNWDNIRQPSLFDQDEQGLRRIK